MRHLIALVIISLSAFNLFAETQFYYTRIDPTVGTNEKTIEKVDKFTKNVAPNLEVPVIFTLDNKGGEITSTLPLPNKLFELANVLYQKQRKPLFIYVERFCHSMCIPTFFELLRLSKLNPDKLVVKVHENALFGFHGVHRFGMVSLAGATEYFIPLIRSGVNEEWINKNAEIFTTIDVTFKKPGQLIAENFGIITQSDVFQSSK